jgi:hypothetical protein
VLRFSTFNLGMTPEVNGTVSRIGVGSKTCRQATRHRADRETRFMDAIRFVETRFTGGTCRLKHVSWAEHVP